MGTPTLGHRCHPRPPFGGPDVKQPTCNDNFSFLIQFEQVWLSLDKFHPIWTSSILLIRSVSRLFEQLQSSIFELTTMFLVLYLWRNKKKTYLFNLKEDVYEQLYVYSYCLFVFKPVFCCFFFFFTLPDLLLHHTNNPLNTIKLMKNNLAGQKIRQLNFDLSKLSSNDYWIFGHWIDWLKKMHMSSFKKLDFSHNFRLFWLCQGW